MVADAFSDRGGIPATNHGLMLHVTIRLTTHNSARSNPPASAAPFTAAMVGKGNRISA